MKTFRIFEEEQEEEDVENSSQVKQIWEKENDTVGLDLDFNDCRPPITQNFNDKFYSPKAKTYKDRFS